MKRILFTFMTLVLFSCIEDDKEQVTLTFNRFEKVLFSMNNNNTVDLVKSLQNDFGTFNEVFQTQIIQMSGVEDDAYSRELLRFINHPDMREAYDSVALLYSDLSDIKKELNFSFSQFHHDYPDYPIPEITTFFGGFNYGVVSYDDNIAIGLENFLGVNSKFYGFLRDPDYLRFQKQRKFISSNVVEVWLNKHFEQYLTGKDLLAQMIYKGKLMYCIDRMLPNMSLENKFRFSKEQMDWTVDNESRIWSYFIENDLLYSSHEQEFRSFLYYAPFAKGMPNKSPSRIGYFIGYKIVKEFIRKNDMSLNDMMVLSDARKFLTLSRYKPLK